MLKRFMQRKDDEDGFTLIELMVVVSDHRHPDRHRPADVPGCTHPGAEPRSAVRPSQRPRGREDDVHGQQLVRAGHRDGGTGLPTVEPSLTYVSSAMRRRGSSVRERRFDRDHVVGEPDVGIGHVLLDLRHLGRGNEVCDGRCDLHRRNGPRHSAERDKLDLRVHQLHTARPAEGAVSGPPLRCVGAPTRFSVSAARPLQRIARIADVPADGQNQRDPLEGCRHPFDLRRTAERARHPRRSPEEPREGS